MLCRIARVHLFCRWSGSANSVGLVVRRGHW
jgi:hypothetical protein